MGTYTSESSWEVAATTTKSNSGFQVQSGIKNLTEEFWQRKRWNKVFDLSSWHHYQTLSQQANSQVSCSLCTPSLSQKKLHNPQMEETEKWTTVESQPKWRHRHKETPHTYASHNGSL